MFTKRSSSIRIWNWRKDDYAVMTIIIWQWLWWWKGRMVITTQVLWLKSIHHNWFGRGSSISVETTLAKSNHDSCFDLINISERKMKKRTIPPPWLAPLKGVIFISSGQGGWSWWPFRDHKIFRPSDLSYCTYFLYFARKIKHFFYGCVKQAVFDCNYTDAVLDQSYIGPYRIV